MKAIETKYNGYFFRSRTEARWAVFFDTIGYKWQYEDEGYSLNNGRWYLPDFKLFLPNDKIFYAEVKPLNFDKHENRDDIIDFRIFSKSINHPIIILTGQPEFMAYDVILPTFNIPTEHDNKHTLSLGMFQDYEPYIQIADEYWWQYVVMDENTGIHYLNIDERQARKSFGKRYLEAIQSSKSIRF